MPSPRTFDEFLDDLDNESILDDDILLDDDDLVRLGDLEDPDEGDDEWD